MKWAIYETNSEKWNGPHNKFPTTYRDALEDKPNRLGVGTILMKSLHHKEAKKCMTMVHVYLNS